MHPAARPWFDKASEDRKNASVLFEAGRFAGAVFFAHQTAEKSLKAVLVGVERTKVHTHDIRSLAARLGVPKEIMECVSELNPDYTVSRYPDAANGDPTEAYTERMTREHLDCADKVLEWARSKLAS